MFTCKHTCMHTRAHKLRKLTNQTELKHVVVMLSGQETDLAYSTHSDCSWVDLHRAQVLSKAQHTVESIPAARRCRCSAIWFPMLAHLAPASTGVERHSVVVQTLQSRRLSADERPPAEWHERCAAPLWPLQSSAEGASAPQRHQLQTTVTGNK